ncbi:hypothetical protein XENTR_v10024237 [Xenopus tropicalis]|nr:hypothetical protein XENTR_v10024237 [Xenopus tropicalis]
MPLENCRDFFIAIMPLENCRDFFIAITTFANYRNFRIESSKKSRQFAKKSQSTDHYEKNAFGRFSDVRGLVNVPLGVYLS